MRLRTFEDTRGQGDGTKRFTVISRSSDPVVR